MKLSIPAIGQRDSRWAEKYLGTSSVSKIKDYGCLLCCATMACNYFGKDIDPARLNDEMVRVKGFTNGSFWVWGKLNEVYPDITFDWSVYNEGDCADKPASLDLIDKLLGEKLPVFLKVDFSPGGDVNEHWVLCKGKEGDYIINDPWTGEEYFFTAKYGDPSRYIFAIRVYRGEVSHEPTLEDQVSELKVKVESLEKELASKQLEVGQERNLREDAERTIGELEEMLNQARGERNKAVSDKEIALNQVKEMAEKVVLLTKDIDMLSEEKRVLNDTLRACKSQTMGGLSLWEKVKWLLFKK